MRRLLPLLVLSAALVSTVAVAAPRSCPAGLHPATTAELFFGRDDNGAISAADWRSFVASEITPRFPDALPVAAVYGQRRNPTVSFAREPSKGVFLVLTGAPDDRQKLDLVRGAYDARFHQETVLQVERRACVGF
jgi:hypothetical protein